MEIERKWLIKPQNIPYRLDDLPLYEIEQAYISFRPSIRVRRLLDRTGTESFVLTVKSAAVDGGALAREEFETPIDRAAYTHLLQKKEGGVIRKTRYLYRRKDGLLEEIDVFDGALAGLAYLEIEFPTIDEARQFPSPEWTVRDVTADKRYRNSALVRYGIPQDADIF